ncbi:MAG: sigma-54 dependent transcriptional regulator [Desulfuromonadaceae bacterium]|nr:sigma-54 dependent transcriptional regulator [Desulfuromonadaceae bacterium]
MHETRNTYLPVLLVDDDNTGCSMMALTLREAGVKNVHTISDSRQVLPFLQKEGAAMVLLDLIMPHLSGQELLGDIRRDYPGIQVIVISGANELSLAVECMKLGALDYLNKPFEASRLIACVKNALKINAMQGELLSLKRRMLEDSLDHPAAFEAIKTRSSRMRALFQYTEVIACSPHPILITGETGVGKELMARAVHQLSGVRGEFVSVNAAGLDDATFSDTLFGHKKGAFTGADQAREGLIAHAVGGTLFLDEIGDMEERSQIKLLRLLQEGEYYPVGSDTLKKTTARIVAVTNCNLPERVAEKLFRRDLYYRLCTHEIHIPPLRERPEDIPLLLDHFLNEAALSYHKNPPPVSASAVSNLLGLSFPGNVRELKAMSYDAVARHSEGELNARSFGNQRGRMPVVSCEAPSASSAGHSIDALFGHFPTFHEIEEYLIDEALRRSAGNPNVAAAMLGITRQTIANHRKKSGVVPEMARKPNIIPMENLFEV